VTKMYNEIMINPKSDRVKRVNKSTNILRAGVLALAMASGVMAAPRLTIDGASFNFGYVPQNSAVSHVFWLQSTGDDTLKIIKVQPG
jgi:hypothetical protein